MTPPPLDRHKLAAARLWATSRQPYLATALFSLHAVSRPGIATIAVDPRWRLHLEPEVVDRLDVQELGRVVTHLVGHLLRDHAGRAGEPPDSSWVLAADLEINDDLVGDDLLPDSAPDHPRDFAMAPGQLAERYAAAMAALDPNRRQRRRGWLDCGSGADGCPRPWDGNDGMSERECRLLRKAVAQHVCRHAGRFPGSVPAGWARWADHVLRPAVDWRRVLRAEIRQAVASVAGSVDYTYRRPSRRSSASDEIVLPALIRPRPEIAVVCDTSGSMHDDLLARALAEIEGLVAAQGLRRQLRVLAVDTEVHASSRVTSARQALLVGGGGTDMGAGIHAAVALRPAADVIVVLTDGYTPWPHRAPPSRVVVGLFDQGGPGWDPPAWARTVRIPAS